MARENVTVALSGDGGDEVFAGYRRYRWHCFEERVRRVVPASLRRPFFGMAGALYPKLDWAPRPLRAKATLQELARDTIEAYFSSVSICGTELRRRLFSPSLARELQGYDGVEVLRSHMRRCGSEDPLSQVQYADFKTYLPGDILTKVDRASMASSLEARVPLLDHTLVEWAAGLPSHFKLHGREGKQIFKTALEPYVAKEILYRPKQGFAVPLAAWFRGPLRRRLRDTLLGPVLREVGLVRHRHDRHPARPAPVGRARPQRRSVDIVDDGIVSAAGGRRRPPRRTGAGARPHDGLRPSRWRKPPRRSIFLAVPVGEIQLSDVNPVIDFTRELMAAHLE